MAPEGTGTRARIFLSTVPRLERMAGIGVLATSVLRTSLSPSRLNAFSLTSKSTRYLLPSSSRTSDNVVFTSSRPAKSIVLFRVSRSSNIRLGGSDPKLWTEYLEMRYFEKSLQLSNCPRVILRIIAAEGNSTGGSSGNGT